MAKKNVLTYNEVRTRQALPYEIKIRMSETRLREFIGYYGEDSVVVSFSGGLDSTFALAFIRERYPRVKAVSVPAIECLQNIKLIQKTENVKKVAPRYSQKEIVKKFGFPVVSKKATKSLQALQNPSEKNAKIRNLALTGITSTGRKAKTYTLAKKWRFLIDAPFKISNKCCYYMKETPIQNWCKKNGYASIVATTVEESKSRLDGYCKRGGCNNFEGQGDSVPFSFWTRQDILRYIVEHNIEISEAYGEVKQDENGRYYTTGAQRTGCPVCMFGMEGDEPGNNRFQKLYYEDNRRWKQVIFEWGYKEVLDYFIQNGFENYQYYPVEVLKQMELEKQEKTYGHKYTVEETIKWHEEKEVKA